MTSITWWGPRPGPLVESAGKGSGDASASWRATWVKLLVLAVALAWIVGSGTGLLMRSHHAVPHGDIMAGRVNAPGSVQPLITAHECWTGSSPAQVVRPGHVVVSRGIGPMYAGARMVHLALDQVFAGRPHGLTVHAFCR